MTEYIEWVKEYCKELDSLLATGSISLRQYWDECKTLRSQIDEKIEEEKKKSERSVFKIVEGWFNDD